MEFYFTKELFIAEKIILKNLSRSEGYFVDTPPTPLLNLLVPMPINQTPFTHIPEVFFVILL